MASKNRNPYREGSAYNKILSVIQKDQIVTRQGLLALGFTSADVTVVLSPRAIGATREGADCRGNMSAAGHVYFMEKLKKVKGEDQRFRLRWRKEVLDRHVRSPKVEKVVVKAKKTKKVKTPKVQKVAEVVEVQAVVETPVTSEVTA